MNKWIVGLLAGLGFALHADATDLALDHVVLFDSGVGYFERSAEVSGTSTAELQFTADQINDVIKSLLVVDEGNGTVAAVTYDARDPIDRTLKSFRVNIADNPDRATLLNRLRGVQVRIKTTGSDVEGRVLGVEEHTSTKDEWVVQEWVLNLSSADGIRSINLQDVQDVTVLDETVKADLDAALKVLAGSLDRDKKSIQLSLTGEKQRNVRIGYVLEMPVWKTSYRLELSSNRAFLQGWAHVENTTDEDWQNVHITLVSGRPLSFIQNLYDPIYVSRPVVQMETYGAAAPPVYAEGMPMNKEAKPAIASRNRVRTAHMMVGRAAGAAAPDESMLVASDALEYGGVEAAAQTQEAGELFEYDVDKPVHLPRQKSAMIPIVNQAVKGETLSIYNEGVNALYPLNGVDLDNATKLYLKQGPVTVIEDGTYAGDARLADLQPGEKRLLSYGLDLARRVTVKRGMEPEEVVSMKIVHGTLILQRKFIKVTTYRVANKKDESRKMVLEHPVMQGWDLLEPSRADEVTSDVYRFRRDLAGNKTTDLVIKEQRLEPQQVILSNLEADGLEIYLKQKVIPSKVKEALSRLAELQSDLARLRDQRAVLETRYGEMERDQTRIRENMKVVAPTSDAYSQWERKLIKQEADVDALNKSLEQVRGDESQKRQAIDSFIANLDVE